MRHVSPTVASWELAHRLRQRRLDLGFDVESIRAELNISRPYWSAVENDRTRLSEAKLRDVLEMFEFDEQESCELLALRTAAKERGWWSKQTGLIGDEIERLYGLEDGADRIRSYESSLVTGLLQTEEYAKEVIESDPSVPAANVNRLVDIRMRRQERRTGSDPVMLTSIMSEASLLQRVGTAGSLRRQLSYLAEQVDKYPDNLEIRIHPFSAPPRGAAGSSTLYLLDFPTPHLPTVAWQEAMRIIGLTEEPESVEFLVLCFDLLLETCLSVEESQVLIEEYAQRIDV